MPRPRLFEHPTTLKVSFDAAVMDQLEAISRSNPDGRLQKTDMVRRAVEEYVNARVNAPAVQDMLAVIRERHGIRLVGKKPRSRRALHSNK